MYIKTKLLTAIERNIIYIFGEEVADSGMLYKDEYASELHNREQEIHKVIKSGLYTKSEVE